MVTTTAAAIPMKAFLLAPAGGSGALAPPNVKVGTGDSETSATTWPVWGVVGTAGNSLMGDGGCGGATRAGAGALAAPLPAAVELMPPVGAESNGLTPAVGEEVLGKVCGGLLNDDVAAGIGSAATSASASMSRTSDSFGSGLCATEAGAATHGLAAGTGFSGGAAGLILDPGTTGCGI